VPYPGLTGSDMGQDGHGFWFDRLWYIVIKYRFFRFRGCFNPLDKQVSQSRELPSGMKIRDPDISPQKQKLPSLRLPRRLPHSLLPAVAHADPLPSATILETLELSHSKGVSPGFAGLKSSLVMGINLFTAPSNFMEHFPVFPRRFFAILTPLVVLVSSRFQSSVT